MKTVCFVILACLFFSDFVCPGSIDAEDIDVTVYGDEAYPPYSFEENGKPAGIYTQILLTAFSRMQGYKISIKTVPWKRGLKYLEDGTGFALYPPYYRPHERDYIKLYSVPILEEKIVVFCREEVLESPRNEWPKDYYGLTIGNNTGFSIGGDEFWNAVKSGKIKVDETKGTRENLLKLQARRFDCYMNDRLSVLWEISRLKSKGKEIRIKEGATISVEQSFLGFTDRNSAKFHYKYDFAEKFNAVITEMKEKGEIQKTVDDFLK